MKSFILLGVLALAGTVTAFAQAGAPSTHLTTQQAAKMSADLNQAKSLIAKINTSYHTDFAIAPKMEHAAMMHMARAEMEMAKAVMDMQIIFNPSPLGGFPGGN